MENKSKEDYLMTIYSLYERLDDKSIGVRSVDIAHKLDVSKPSVSEMIKNLAKEGFLKEREAGTEMRRFPRKEVTLPATTFLKGNGDETHSCVVVDISMGGVSVTYQKGPEIGFSSVGEMPHFRLTFKVPPADEEVWFDCNTCHMRDNEKETQVGASFSNPPGHHMQRLSKYLM